MMLSALVDKVLSELKEDMDRVEAQFPQAFERIGAKRRIRPEYRDFVGTLLRRYPGREE